MLTWPNGEPYLTNYLTKTFSTFIRRNHLPELMLYGLWHTFATLANYSGATIHNISRSLGHSTVAAIMLSKKNGAWIAAWLSTPQKQAVGCIFSDPHMKVSTKGTNIAQS